MLAKGKDSAETVVRLRHLIRFRSPSDRIPYANRSDTVRKPIRFRTQTGEKSWRFREKNHNFNQEKPYFYIEKP